MRPGGSGLATIRARANGNGGHVFGTELPAEQKAALLEYLKTL